MQGIAREMMQRRALWIVACIVLVGTHLAAFRIGIERGARAGAANVIEQARAADTQVALGQYLVSRDLAAHLKAGNVSSAKCRADLIASGYFDDIKDCVENAKCRANLAPAVGKEAPEVLDGDPYTRFDYLPLKQGLRTCGS
jgi:hypothetical protein